MRPISQHLQVFTIPFATISTLPLAKLRTHPATASALASSQAE